MQVITEAIALISVFMIALLVERWHPVWLRTVERGFARMAQWRGVSFVLVVLLALGASATLSLLGHIPAPAVHDEFSYLLAADTADANAKQATIALQKEVERLKAELAETQKKLTGQQSPSPPAATPSP
jgi:hypothetical protein